MSRRKTKRTLIIKGGSGDRLDTAYLTSISDQIVRAKMARDPIRIDLDIFLIVLNELIERRLEEKSDSDMVEEMLSDEATLEESFYLKISDSRATPLGFSDLEVFDLDDLEDYSGEMEALEEITEEDVLLSEEDELVEPVIEAPAPLTRQDYWVPAVDPTRVIVASLVGFLALALLVIVGV